MSLQTRTFGYANIQKIDVNCNIFNIRVVESTSDSIEISWSDTVMRSLEVTEKDGVLTILDHAAVGIYGTLALINLKKDAQLLIKLPAAYAGKAIFQTKSEPVHITDLSSPTMVGISSSTGEILIENASFQQLDIRGNVGKINCYSLDTTGSIVITSKSGPIACHLLGDESDYSISCSTRNRRCNTNGNFGNGPKKVILNSDHGEVSYSFQNGFDGGRPSNRYNRKDSFKEW